MLNEIVLKEFDIKSIIKLIDDKIEIIAKRNCGISNYSIKEKIDIEYELRIGKNILINNKIK